MAFKMKDTGLYKRTASKNGSTFMHTAKFGQETSIGEIEAVKKHNKRHQRGETHAPGNKTGKYKDSIINAGEWSAKKEGGEGGPKKYKKKPVAKKHHAMKKHEPAHKKHHAMKKHKPGHDEKGDSGMTKDQMLVKELNKAIKEGNDRKVNEIRRKLVKMYEGETGDKAFQKADKAYKKYKKQKPVAKKYHK